MPRKSTKTAAKTKAKKVEEKLEEKVEVNAGMILSWDDETCKKMEGTIHIPLIDVKSILQAAVATEQKYNSLMGILSRGEMTAYVIKCPHCQEKYHVSSMELNREAEVACKKCEKTFKENENIEGIYFEGKANTEGLNIVEEGK